MINKTRLINLTQQLIRINSANPGGDEREIARFVKKYLADFGVGSNIYEFAKRRSNIVAFIPGLDRARSLLITPHLDTVPSGKNWTIPPFSAKIKNGRIYGLGATDCKCNLAVSMEVINSLIEDKQELGYNLIFSATADEESGSELGLMKLLDNRLLEPDAALVLDADEFHIVVAQKGLMHLKIKIKGKKAHGAYPWLGKNAIDTALALIKNLKDYRFKCTRNEYLKYPTINIGTIQGGDKVNVVADWCEFEADLRFLPGESSRKVLKDISRMAHKINPKCEIEVEGIQEPFLICRKHSLVQGLIKAMQKSAVRPLITGSEGATTISFFQEKNIPAVATGFGSYGCAHMEDEYVAIKNLCKGALILEDFLKNYRFNKN